MTNHHFITTLHAGIVLDTGLKLIPLELTLKFLTLAFISVLFLSCEGPTPHKKEKKTAISEKNGDGDTEARGDSLPTDKDSMRSYPFEKKLQRNMKLTVSLRLDDSTSSFCPFSVSLYTFPQLSYFINLDGIFGWLVLSEN